MRETEFENFLNADSNIVSKTKAVRSRKDRVLKITGFYKNFVDMCVF
ncbi:hypothetical protein ACETAC_04190 [Aceticella autotrophica]|uniref:Uncharacterized protein n=1 Tax=Aceticella autotrophica TaxID=2755338 RepID=A0A975AX84_9THEO|nr:hypothetical protein [Aceticella autotrophica]QSZ28063.1 hypothetical protein ACETAC_04190 [Aceticella autotrophica]